MRLPGLTQRKLEGNGLGAYFRPRDVEALGISYRRLQQLVLDGTVQDVGRGLYRLAAIDSHQHEAMAMVNSAAPSAVICLISALQFHNLGSQTSPEVWIAIDRKARQPVRLPIRTRVVRFSGAMLTHGVEEHEVLGVTVRVTSPARTVVDCFRYRNKIGLDVAVEALRDVVRTRKAKLDDILHAAKACRARTVVMPFLDAMAM